MSEPRRGCLVVLSAPSGGGKSTVIKEIVRRRPDFTYSVSATTRPRRQYETDGVHYHFLSREEFETGIHEGRFLEWEEVHGDLYGTDRHPIDSAVSEGRNVLLDIDVNGGERVAAAFPETILIFLYPPSLDELRRRLRARGADDESAIERRLARYPMEKEKGDRYPHRIVNEDIEVTIEAIMSIIESYRDKGEQ